MPIFRVTYKHEHNCSRSGEVVHVFPETKGGAAFMATPRCIEPGPLFMSALLLVGPDQPPKED